ncbi:MAG: DUF4861 domain-containing protein, partial [Bacteroidaceae bacterium]|nr:DUF4861 domain-containing protein [Bacteroidaceae bacterium]
MWAPEPVGLAVYVPKEYDLDTQEDDLNYLCVLKADQQQRIRYYVSFCADKEERGYHTAEEWFASLEKWKEGVNHPVSVKVK